MVVNAADVDVSALEEKIPMGCLTQPAEMVAFASWLMGPENTKLSGSSLITDGALVRM